MRSLFRTAVTALVLALALYGGVGFVTQKPWQSRSITVRNDGKAADEREWTPYDTSASNREPTLIEKGLAWIKKPNTDRASEEKEAMEEYFISSASLFPPVEEIPVALGLARNGNRDALEIAITDLRAGREALTRLRPPQPLEEIHADTLRMVDAEIANLEKLRTLPLPDEDAFQAYLASTERKALVEENAKVVDKVQAVISLYQLELPTSIFGGTS
ncbi:MAG: hypothetical protein HY460_01990 [Parcubacteria group bacterium]|nr:hypothetical protein [Parcubacteria group bacterium]